MSILCRTSPQTAEDLGDQQPHAGLGTGGIRQAQPMPPAQWGVRPGAARRRPTRQVPTQGVAHTLGNTRRGKKEANKLKHITSLELG